MSDLLKNDLWLRPRNLLLVFLTLAGLMIISALVELDRSREELTELMTEQSHNLLQALLISSQNSLHANQFVEDLLEEKLYLTAGYIRTAYQNGHVSNRYLQQVAAQNNIHRIHIFSPDGRKRFSSHTRVHFRGEGHFSPADSLRDIFQGKTDTLAFGLRPARYEPGARLTIAIAAEDRSAIVLNLDAESLYHFRRQIGFGVMLSKMIEQPGIVYVALQDSNTILAASGNVESLEDIPASPFLSRALGQGIFDSRFSEFDSLTIFEAVHPFDFQGQTVGLFRLGLSLDPLQQINDRIYRRIVIITLVLIVVGFFLLTLIFIRQNLDTLSRKYQEVETFSSQVIRNVSDAIVLVDGQCRISLVNAAAGQLFGIGAPEIHGRHLSTILPQETCEAIQNQDSTLYPVDCRIGERPANLLISTSAFLDQNQQKRIIMVIRDLTEQKLLEAQLQRRERLSAMGELASGVAHEIRNPLNTIGTIAQQLDSDFEPVRDGEEFHQLAGLVHSEVKRINNTIQDFLRFARPARVNPQPFAVADLIEKLVQQYRSLAHQKNLKFSGDIAWQGEVVWDRQQIQQALMNLLQNSIDALPAGGEFGIRVNSAPGEIIEISVFDDGPGIPEPVRNKIFNLYFTTKAEGTGIGLSLVQQIVDAHGGTITAGNPPHGPGALFILRLPRLCPTPGGLP
ncbi:MAG: PAS domain S-box protein [Calditrichaeota bacterium]|nr:PAS domain S-box protein [Calditrichota bacterium]